MNVLELFAGSRSIGKMGEVLGYNIFSSDLDPDGKLTGIDYVVDIFDFDVSKVPFVPDVIWASPPCTFFSVMSIGKHWHKDHTPKTEDAVLGIKIVEATLAIIYHFLEINPRLKWYMENPQGKLKKLEVVEGLPIVTVWYCRYGDFRAKPTNIWSNNFYNATVNPLGFKPEPPCKNGNKDCHHQPAKRGSNHGTQSIKGNYARSKIPEALCYSVLNCANLRRASNG